MKKNKKNFIIAGNWKMNPDTREDARRISAGIAREAKKARRTTVIIAPPAPFIRDLVGKGPLHVGAQDVSEVVSGSFTGSVSARQLRSAGAEFAIIGHSERRKAGDTDAIIAKKAKQAFEAGLRIILCIGENERDEHAHYLRTVHDQLVAVTTAVDKKLGKSLIVAYEPVWAVGKSYDKAMKSSDIHEMAIYIRKAAAEIFGKNIGLKVPVLYGGSVDFENAKTILKDSSVDGLLIGRTSLDPKAFGDIIKYADSL